MQALPGEARAAALGRVAAALEAQEAAILEANRLDLEHAPADLPAATRQRLGLKAGKLRQLATGIRAIAAMPDPIGNPLRKTEVAEGLVLQQVTAPIGVLLIIFEARPDALPQIAALALKSGNGLLLKGGKEAARSNRTLHRVFVEAMGPEVPAGLVQLVETRDEIGDLLRHDDLIDLVIPRGSNALVKHIQAHTKIPVMGHADGICHIFVDREVRGAAPIPHCPPPAPRALGAPAWRVGALGTSSRSGTGQSSSSIRVFRCAIASRAFARLAQSRRHLPRSAPRRPPPGCPCGHHRPPRPGILTPVLLPPLQVDVAQAVAVCVDSKVDYPAACNAVEAILVHRAHLETGVLDRITSALAEAGVKLHGGARAAGELGLEAAPSARHEYGALAVTVELVDGLDAAIDYIHANGSGHTVRGGAAPPPYPPPGRSPPGFLTRPRRRASSRPTRPTRPPSRSGWTARACSSTPARGSPTGFGSGWARRSASPPAGCTPGARSAWTGCSRPSGSCRARATSWRRTPTSPTRTRP